MAERKNPHSEKDSPTGKSPETPSRFYNRSTELIENYSSIMMTLFLILTLLNIGSFFYSFSLNRKMDNSVEVLYRIRQLERAPRLEEVEKKTEENSNRIRRLEQGR